MAYMMQIFPEEEKSHPIPKIGDLFIVTDIGPSMDLHYGNFTYVSLKLATDDDILISSNQILIRIMRKKD